MMPELEYMHSTEKARDTTPNDEKILATIIHCSNNTHQGRHIPANKRALALQTYVKVVVVVYSFNKHWQMQCIQKL